jgi:5'-nucleotidase
VRIAFDADAVLSDAESQKVYDERGLDAFHEHEAAHADEPMSPGPFRPFLDGLARIQARFGAASPVRTALVTARAAPAHIRVVNTLRAWGVTVDETYFLGGVDKTEVLKAFGAHIFFDDQHIHVTRAAAKVPAAQVLWPEDDLPAAPASKPTVARARGTTRGKTATPAPPRGAKRQAAPRARARSAR